MTHAHPASRQHGFVLCADDYAMTPGVTRGILALLEAGRITATGAMTNRPHWREAAPALAPFHGRADLGVHLNLTCGQPLTAMPGFAPNGDLPKLPRILAGGIAGRLPEAEIAAEFSAQLDAFEHITGRMPDFIDGHQHVHALPGVRKALLRVVMTRYHAGQRPYLRDPADEAGAIRQRGRFIKKALLLAGLTRAFGPAARAAGFVTNRGFSGYSGFTGDNYAGDFATYLVALGSAHLVMCHPGEVDDDLRALDPATDSRPLEMAFFLSDRFLELCAERGMKPARFSEL